MGKGWRFCIICHIMDKKAQMMDAGTVLLTAGDRQSALEAVSAIMQDYGKVTGEPSEVPSTTGPCDLFLDFSSPWRNRYISCTVEGAGNGRFAAVFKQGDTPAPLRTAVFILAAAAVITAAFLMPAKGVSVPTGIAIAVYIAYRWLIPSRKAIRTVRKIQSRLRDSNPRPAHYE